MPKLTKAGRTLIRDTVADKLRGGRHVTYDGDGRELVECAIPATWEPYGDGDCSFIFKGLAQGKCSRMGMATAWAAFPPGDIHKTQALIGGTIGRTLSKWVDVALEDQQLYVGMLVDIDQLAYTIEFPKE